jgi:PAS domain S-box-containing protein
MTARLDPNPASTPVAPGDRDDASWRELAQSLPETVFETDASGRFTFVNSSGLDRFGYTAADLARGLQVPEMVVPAQREEARKNLFTRVSGGARENHEYQALCRDGRTFPAIVRATPIVRDGVPVGMRGILVDISERKHAEEQLRYRVELERLIMGVSTQFIDADPSAVDARMIDALGAIGRFMGVERSYVFAFLESGNLIDNTHEWVAEGVAREQQNLRRVSVDEAFPWFGEHIRRREVLEISDVSALPPEASKESEELTREGIQSLVCVPMVHGKDLVGFLGLDALRQQRRWTRDETALLRVVGEIFTSAIVRKRTQEALLESERRYQAVVETTHTGFVVLDLAGRVLDANAEYVGMSGHRTLDEVLGRSVLDWTVAHHRARNAYAVARCAAQGFVSEIEVEYQHATGTIVPVEINATRLEGAEQIIALVRDISERKQRDEDLRIKDAAIASSINAIGIADLDGRVVYVNDAFLRLWGYDAPDQVLGRLATDLWDDSRNATAVVNGLLAAGQWAGELVAKRRDGTTVPVQLSAHAVFSPDSKRPIRVMASFIDIGARKRLEIELLRAQKLESIGLLAGGIAHDFNNILTGILANVSFVRSRIGREPRLSESLAEAERAALRARDLTQQLLTFARGGAPVRAPVAVGPLLADAVPFALRGRGSGHTVQVDPDLWSIDADAGQVGQVVHNLVLNASQAMAGAGTVAVSAENVELREGEEAGLHRGRYVRLTVSDRGAGIPEEHLGRIFDPYFTTKQDGSGLGLAVTYSVVRNHGGGISVESTPDQGSTFTVHLPASEGSAEPRPTPSAALVSGQGRVLVMDDDEMIRAVAAGILGELGYDVTPAAEGREALQLYREAREQGRPFDLVLVDLTVPGGMGGRDAVRELRLLDPDVRAIVSSGYHDDPIMASYRNYGFADVLPKPFTAEILGQVVARNLRR